MPVSGPKHTMIIAARNTTPTLSQPICRPSTCAANVTDVVVGTKSKFRKLERTSQAKQQNFIEGTRDYEAASSHLTNRNAL